MMIVVFSGSNSKCEGNGNHTVVISGSYGSVMVMMVDFIG